MDVKDKYENLLEKLSGSPVSRRSTFMNPTYEFCVRMS